MEISFPSQTFHFSFSYILT